MPSDHVPPDLLPRDPVDLLLPSATLRQRFPQMFANVRGVYWDAWIAADGVMNRVDLVTPQLEEMLGYPMGDWLAKPNFWLSIVHPDDRERAEREAEAIFRGGSGGASRFRWVGRSGRLVWVETLAVVIVGEDGAPTGMRGLTLDITERVEAESRLRTQVLFTRALTASLGEGLYAVDTDQRLTFINPAAERMVGWTQDELTGTLAHERFHHLRPDGTPLPFEDCPLVVAKRAGRDLRDHEDFFVRRDGTTFPVLCTAAAIVNNGEVVGSVVTFQDISERRRAEQRRALRHQVTQIVSESVTLQGGTGRVLQVLCEGLGWDFGAVWMVDGPAALLRCVEVFHAPEQALAEFAAATRKCVLPSGVGLPGRVWKEARSTWIPDVTHDDNFPRAPVAAAQGLHGALGAPIRFGSEILGVIEFFHREIREPDEDLLETMSVVAIQIGLFIARKRAEEAVRESEARKTAILESAIDAIITMDADSRVVEMNPAAEAMFGHRRVDAIGGDLANLIIPPRFRDEHRRGLERYRETGVGWVVGQRREVTAQRADGSEFPVEIAVTRIRSEGPPMFSGYVRDVSERKRAEAIEAARSRQAALRAAVGVALADAGDLRALLQRSAEAFARYLDAERVCIWTIDGDRRVLELQASADAGGAANEAIDPLQAGVPIDDVARVGVIGRIYRARDPLVANRVAADLDLHRVWVEGDRLLSVAGAPLRGEKGAVGVLALLRREPFPEDTADVLASVCPAIAQGIVRQQTENEIVMRSRQLKTLLNVVSHDLKEPLRAIENFSEMLESRYRSSLDETGQNLLRRVVRAAERLHRLLDDVLALTRVRQMAPPQQKVPGALLVGEALARLEHKIAESGARVSVVDGLPLLRVDRTWATQAIYNLIVNALKFTVAGQPPDVEIGVHGQNGIVVRDRGRGVQPEQRERIFELFQRAVGGEVEGTGAGLAIVAEVAARHGGKAWVQPRPGGGSEFVITFGRTA